MIFSKLTNPRFLKWGPHVGVTTAVLGILAGDALDAPALGTVAFVVGGAVMVTALASHQIPRKGKQAGSGGRRHFRD